MNHKKLIAGILAITLMGSGAFLPPNAVKTLSDSIVMSVSAAGTNYSCSSFDFDASTGTMTLKGNVNADDIKNFNQKSNVISIKAEIKTVFPSDSSNLFRDYSKAESIDLKNVDTSNVTDMSYMFYHCPSLRSLDVSGFDTSNVTNMQCMFYVGATFASSNLGALDLRNFNTENVTNMRCMFYNCSSLTSLDLSSFDTSKVTDMAWMFTDCSSLKELDLNGFDTSNVTDMSGMFDHCKLTSLDLSGFDTSNVTDMRSMFSYCSKLTSLDLSGFDTSNVTHMRGMFSYCSKLTSLDLSGFDTSNVTFMSYMFRECSSLTSLDLSSFDTSKVTDMSQMFRECSFLTSLDLSSFDTSKVTDMSQMFYKCSSLTSLDLSSFDTSQITDKSGIFSNCSSLKTVLISEANKITINDALILNGLSTADIDLLIPIRNFTTSSAISGGMTLDEGVITSDDLDHASIKSVDWYLMNADGTPGDEVTGGTAQAGKDYMAVVYLEADDGYCYTENSEISAENGEIAASLLITEGTSKYISIGVNFSNVPKGTGKLEYTIPPLEIDKSLFFQVRKFINTIDGQQDENYTVTVYDRNGLLGDERFPGTVVVENGQIVSFDPVLAHKLADDEEFEFVIVNTNPNYEFTSEDITVKGQENCDSCKLYDNSLHVFYKAEAWKTIVNIECPEDMTEPITVEFIRKDNGTLAKRKVVTPENGLAKFSLAGFSSEYYVTFNSATYTAESYYYRNGNGSIPKVLMVKMAPCPVVTSASLTLDGTIGVNIKAEIPDEFMKCQAALHYDGTTTKTKFYTIKNLTKDSNGRYVFTFPVAAKEIADKVSFEIYDANFKPIKIVKGTAKAEIADNSFQYAATDYINSKKSSSDTKLASLCKALSDFGNASRIMFNYNATGAKIEQSLSGVTAATLKPYQLVRDEECVDGIKISSASLIIESETTINIKFKTTRSSISGYTFTCDGKVVTPTKIADGEYQVQVTNISAADLDKAHTISVSDGKNTQKITYSALSYAYSKISSTDTKLSNLVKTLYLYNKAAKTYLGR